MKFDDNLELKRNNASRAPASVSGVIYDTSILIGVIVPDATVVVYDTSFNIVATMTTDLLGAYLIAGLDSNRNYRILVGKDGYSTTVSTLFSPGILLPTVINMAIVPNSNEDLNTIYGIVKDSNSNLSIANAIITLSNLSTGNIFSQTLTISDGEYAIYNIPSGTYKSSIYKAEYFPSINNQFAVTTAQNLYSSVNLAPDTSYSSGIIYGVITDNNSNRISNAFVGLYSINTDLKTETLIEYTYTNSNGNYVFGNVISNSYIVKAKLSTS